MGANEGGAAAKPLLPTFRAMAKMADENLANIFERVIDNIEKAKPVTVPEAEAKRSATIRKEIREFVAGLKEKTVK